MPYVPNKVAYTDTIRTLTDKLNNLMDVLKDTYTLPIERIEESETGSTLVSPSDRAYWDGKADVSYVDAQITSVSATGIPKLMMYPYVLTASIEGQTDFEIPMETFDINTDTVFVIQNTAFLTSDMFTLVAPKTVSLVSGVTVGTSIGIVVLKNVPIGEDGSINGRCLAIQSVPADRIIQDLNNKFVTQREQNKLGEYNIDTSSYDANGYPTVVTYTRASDATLYMKTTVSTPDSNGWYTVLTVEEYDDFGTSVLYTTVWDITYNTDGSIKTILKR